MVRYLEFIKAICKQSDMWELNNPRVIAMVDNIFKCIQSEDSLKDKDKELMINIVLSNLIIFGKYKIS